MALCGAGLITVTTAAAWACGPWFTPQLLDDRAATLGTAPKNTFAFEAAHLLPASDGLLAVERGESNMDVDVDVDAPADVQLYGIGAYDWYQVVSQCPAAGEDDRGNASARPPCRDYDGGTLARAETAFNEVLALPLEKAKNRGAHAAYMLGKVHALRLASMAGTAAFEPERDAAASAFQETRARVLAGALDPQGLAVASFGEEARLYLYVGDKACFWAELMTKDACAGALDPAEIKHAIALYAAQAGHGSASAVHSLSALAATVLDQPEQTRSLADSAVAQRLLVAYALAWVAPANTDRQPILALENLLDAITMAGPDKVVGADRLASLTYELGRYDDAARLLANVQTPLASWIRAKLALRRGDRNEAARSFAQAAKAFPRADDPKASLDAESMQRVEGERGVLALARGDFMEAMTGMYAGSIRDGMYWSDLVYVGERVLTVDELKSFVDEHTKSASRSPGKNDPEEAYRWVSLNDRLRRLLARRMMRVGRFDDAYDYFPAGIDRRMAVVDIRATARAYVDALHEGDHGWTDIGKAEARYAAARIAREHGMELLGYEQAPDYAGSSGTSLYGGGQPAETLKGSYVTERERQRFTESNARPDQRFHYRYVAAEHAAAAADLLPPRSQAFAATLCVATHWVEEGPPGYPERMVGDGSVRISEGQRRAQTYYARYVKQGAYVDWAGDFGSSCEEPDFAKARAFKRAQQFQAAKQFVRSMLSVR